MDVAFRLRSPLTTLWRATGELQVGLDAQTAVLLPAAPRAAERVVQAFETWRTPADVVRLVPDVAAAWVADAVARLVAGGTLVSGPGSDAAGPVVVVGSGLIARQLVRLLAAGGVAALRVVTPPDADPLASRRRWQDLAGPSTRVGVFAQWHAALDDAVALVIVVTGTVEPDRVLTDHLRRSRLAHLVVRTEPERAVVGPFVVPGRGPCVRCLDLARRDLDPEWPLLLSQLSRTAHSPGDLFAAWAASSAAAQALAWLGHQRAGTCGATLELASDSLALETRAWPAHPGCGCLQPW